MSSMVLVQKRLRWGCETSKITAIDCSGFIRYLVYQATNKQVVMPDGSMNQRPWCENLKMQKVDYSTAKNSDGWLRIAFITPPKNSISHLWFILDGLTLESHVLTKGSDRRLWDIKDLKKSVSACYKFAQTFNHNRNIDIRYLA